MDPKDWENHALLGHVLLAKGQVDEAVAEHERALKLNRCPHTYDDLGAALAAKGQLDKAISQYKRALENEGYTEINVSKMTATTVGASAEVAASAYYHLGQALEKKGDKAGALDAYRKAVERAPTNPEYKEKLDSYSKQA